MASMLTGYAQLQARFHALTSVGDHGLMRAFGAAAVAEEKALVRRRTGTTARSIRVAATTATSARLEAGFAAAFLEYGTRPHEITPKAARVLAWGGARRLSGTLRSGSKPTNFAMRVHHPGTRPYPFMIPGAKIAIAKTGANAIVTVWNGAA